MHPIADELKSGNSNDSEFPEQKPEEWELDELIVGDPDYSTVGIIAIFHKKGERLGAALGRSR